MKNIKKLWIENIKKVARKKYKFLESGINNTDWDIFWESYGIDGLSPEEALKEDFSNT
jgi:hypothetical protein